MPAIDLVQAVIRLLALPGPVSDHFKVVFSLAPVAGYAFLGAAISPELNRDDELGWQSIGAIGAVSLTLFVLVRFIGMRVQASL